MHLLLVLALLIVVSWEAISSTCKQAGQIALTFDQGPASLTGRLLDILHDKGVKVGFHISSEYLRNATLLEYVKRAWREGHQVGIFIPESLSHGPDGSDAKSHANLFDHLTRTSNWLNSLMGSTPQYVRFGSKRPIAGTLRKSIESLGLTITKARLEIRDENNKMDSIWGSLGRGLAQASPANNSFILRQRDWMTNSVASVDKMIDYLRERGYTLVSLAECVPPKKK